MERKLASIQEIIDLNPIEGADMIEVATVKGWKLVTKKGEYKVGDRAIYCEIDSYLPTTEEFEFLRKTSFKKMGELEGFRLKTIKLRGQVSQGLLLPVDTLLSKMTPETFASLNIGDDVAEILGIIKYEPPIPASLSGVMKGIFPSFMPKTDEERIQNLSESFEELRNGNYYVTEKLDGSSVTFYCNNGEFGVCSRNLELIDTPENSLWKAAREMELVEKMPSLGNVCLQGEIIGEGIQGNPYKLCGQKVYFFNMYNIDKSEYFDFHYMNDTLAVLGLNIVPLLNPSYTLPPTVDELLAYADGKSALHKDTDREGVVIRSRDKRVSFKVISNKFLLKEK